MGVGIPAYGQRGGQAYIREMNYCVEFALANRKLMMDRIIDIFKKKYTDVLMPIKVSPESDSETRGASFCGIVFDPMINIAHNYAVMENHFGHNVMVHRKGATSARLGQIGIIPGSQGTKSYIVEGLANPESFNSCSHGAGRRMGRKQAQRELSFENEVKQLNDAGIIHSIRSVKDLDEAPGSYKDIEDVMKNQEDLVKIKVELQPLAVIKG